MNADVDWSIIANSAVEEAVQKAASVVARDFSGIVERDDLMQEAYILCATNAERIRGYLLNEELGHVYRWIWSRLVDIVRPQANRSNQTVSLSRFPTD